ncbi:MAG: thiol-disulfide oxidoreductase DCC family protein [Candidatus Tectimicrobiota bacterium]
MSPAADHDTPVILFDGVCHLCQASVQFVIARDPQARLRFASLQSPVGQRLLAARALDRQALDSVVLLEGSRYWTESDAALRIARYLTGCWPALGVLRLIPRPWRNALYRWIARHRYAWFGQSTTCMLPTPDLRRRFLD